MRERTGGEKCGIKGYDIEWARVAAEYRSGRNAQSGLRFGGDLSDGLDHRVVRFIDDPSHGDRDLRAKLAHEVNGDLVITD